MEANRERSAVVLIVDDKPVNIDVARATLEHAGYRVLIAKDGEKAISRAAETRPDLILLDILMPGIDGFETCRRLKRDERTRDIPVIFMSALNDPIDRVKGLEIGAIDFISKPFNEIEALARVNAHVGLKRAQEELRQLNEQLEHKVEERTEELAKTNRNLADALAEVERLRAKLQEENAYLREEIKTEYDFSNIIGESAALKSALDAVARVAPTDSTVLILGETGVGKELVARATHNLGARKDRPLVKVNCATLPANLIESELFGHERGAFTGATQRKTGRFELADGGALFLDEIGELPLELQPKLLRALQEGEFERVGGTTPVRVDVRIVAATNRDLEDLVEEGKFREDLFYRLNVFPIVVPPLRERPEDIPRLVEAFVEEFARRFNRRYRPIPPDDMRLLQSYHWPGNVRELRHFVERAAILSESGELPFREMPFPKRSFAQPERLTEKDRIVKTLEECNWNVEGKRGAAKRLDLNPSTLRYRMKKYGIERPN